MAGSYEPLVDSMSNDPKDRHVLAAAVRANAQVIATFNVRDFPVTAVEAVRTAPASAHPLAGTAVRQNARDGPP